MWLATKEQSRLAFEKLKRGSPEELLVEHMQGRRSFAQAFQMLASYAGLHCLVATGYVKGYGYRPGAQFPANEKKQSWNLVMINGIWRQVDCLRAAKCVWCPVSFDHCRSSMFIYQFIIKNHCDHIRIYS